MGAQRRALREPLRRTAAAHVARRFWRLPQARRARALACYTAMRGEMSCKPIVAAAHARGIILCMPVLQADRLGFAQLARRGRTRRNRFGIPEPLASRGRCRAAATFDVIVLPLVAFDLSGRRLGTGGGFYDRTLQSVARRRWCRRPLLVGIGYDFQCVPHLPDRPWDVPLDVIITETKLVTFTR
jgi:5-formyltetrahydrofolate cyclo-ligase